MDKNIKKHIENPLDAMEGLTKKQKHYATLRSAGVPLKQASEMAGYNEKYCYDLDKKLGKYSLRRPEIQKLAWKAIKNILKMKPVINDNTKEKIFPTFTNQLVASQMVMDRVEPVKQVVENVSVNFTNVNLDAVKNKEIIKEIKIDEKK